MELAMVLSFSFQLLGAEPATSPLTRPQIEEQMKQTYSDADWAHFFSLSRYYRLKFSPKEKTEVQLLEALALLRHCQQIPLNELLLQLESEWQNSNVSRESLKQIKSLSETHFRGKQAVDQQTELNAIQAHFSGTSFRRASLDSFLKSDPRKSIIRVRNLCE